MQVSSGGVVGGGVVGGGVVGGGVAGGPVGIYCVTITIHRIAGKFDGELNLVFWQLGLKLPN